MHFTPIGTVHNKAKEKNDQGWGSVQSEIFIRPDLKDGLIGLGQFSHIIVVTYLHEAEFIPEKPLVRRIRGREDLPRLGIFCQRAKDRPNPIGITAVRLLGVSDDTVTVSGLDAIDGTPVLDIKPYNPAFDRRDDAVVPDWMDEIMRTYF